MSFFFLLPVLSCFYFLVIIYLLSLIHLTAPNLFFLLLLSVLKSLDVTSSFNRPLLFYSFKLPFSFFSFPLLFCDCACFIPFIPSILVITFCVFIFYIQLDFLVFGSTVECFSLYLLSSRVSCFFALFLKVLCKKRLLLSPLWTVSQDDTRSNWHTT